MQTEHTAEHTNEGLAAVIQEGQRELIFELWQNVQPFALQQAARFHRLTAHIAGLDTADYLQEAFIALYEAVASYDESRGAFLTYYAFRLKTAFAAACGLRTVRDRNDPLQHHASLDAQIMIDDESGSTLAELLPDESAEAAFDSAEAGIWNEELHGALLRAVELLPEREQIAVNGFYLDAKTPAEIAERLGVTSNRVYAICREGTARMRRQSRQTRLCDFWDETNLYRFTGRGHFERTGCSSQQTLLEMKERREARRLRA